MIIRHVDWFHCLLEIPINQIVKVDSGTKREVVGVMVWSLLMQDIDWVLFFIEVPKLTDCRGL